MALKHTLGDGAGPRLGVRLLDRAAEREILLRPALAFGELYMNGRLVVTRGSLYEVLELGARNLADVKVFPWVKAINKLRVAFRCSASAERSQARENKYCASL